MSTINPDLEYYAITLTAEAEGRVTRSVQTHFVGFTKDRPRRELRIGSLVIADNMAHIWKALGQGYLVVSNLTQLAIFIRLGGNALVERRIAEEFFRDLVRENEVGGAGPLGSQIVSRDLPTPELNRAPSRTQRMRIIRRDGYRCRICGRRPTENVDIQLDVHHIAAWGRGGLTVDSNLITVCDTCHDGLDDFHRLEVFSLLDPTWGLGRGPADFKRRVTNYRQKIRAIESKLEGQTPRPSRRRK